MLAASRSILSAVLLLCSLSLALPVAAAGPKRPRRKGRTEASRPVPPDMEPELRQRVEETLAEALASRDALAQGRALAALVDLGDEAARRRVQEALAEENWGIKRYALLITGREDQKAFYPVMAKTLENTTSRPHAFNLIEMLPAAVRVKVLSTAIRSSEDSLREEVVRRLLDQGDEEAIEVISTLVDSKDPKLRGEGISTFIRLQSQAGVRYLMTLAKSRETEIRRAAQDALLKSRDPQVKPFLMEMLRKSQDLRVRVEAARALASKGTRDEVLPVLKKALDEREVELRVMGMEGIAALGDRVVAAELRPLATNYREDKRISTAALKVLGGTGDLANLEVLRKALGLDYLHLRVAAAQAMGDLKRREAIPDLARALQDGNEQVRGAAAVSLGKVGGAEIVPHLQQAADREIDPRVQQNIIEALGRSGVSEGFMALQVLLVHPDPKVKGAAVEAILEIGDPHSANTLLVVVDPRFPEVMQKAIRAICLLEPKLGMTALKPHLRRVTLRLLHDLHNEAGPRGSIYLKAFLEEGTIEQRSLALDLLLRRGAKGVELVRSAAAANDNHGIRRSALRSLLARSDKGAIEVFLKGFDDDDDGIRGISVEALGLLGSKEAHQVAILRMMEDRTPSVRAAASHALIRLASGG